MPILATENPMDPIFEIGKDLVKIAVEMARRYHEKAQDKKASDIEKMCNYIAMARVSVVGLVQERDAILSEATILGVLDLRNEQEARTASCTLRLQRYMNESRLVRPLNLAIQGMEQYRDVLAKYLTGVLGWVSVSNIEKKTALDDVQDLINQVKFFREKLKYKEKPSGVGLSHLKDLQRALVDHRKSEILAAVTNARNADDSECSEIELRLDLISNNLNIAFR
jgi:hypothetical protein